MRYLSIAILVLLLITSAFPAEILISLERWQIINNPVDFSAPSKIAISFVLPEVLRDKEIIFAELQGKIPLRSDSPDSLFELYFWPLLSEMPDNNIDYDNIRQITDSLGAGLTTVKVSDTTGLFIDFTEFIRQISANERRNYGLIGTGDLLGEGNIKLPESLSESILRTFRIRVIYR